LNAPYVRSTRGREVRFEPLAPTPPFDVDGETLPCTSCRVRVLAGGLKVLA
jgi:diacylglycerol kinase family enzyme